MDYATCLRMVRRGGLAATLVLTGAAALAADAHTHFRPHPYQPLAERNRITVDAQRLQGSPESRRFQPRQRQSFPATPAVTVARGRDHGPVATYTPRWEMLDFCPNRGFYPDIRECPGGWQRVRVDVGP